MLQGGEEFVRKHETVRQTVSQETAMEWGDKSRGDNCTQRGHSRTTSSEE